MKKKPNTASQAYKHAANSVQKSDHWLGDYFRRMKAKGGNKYAITATAAKIARIYYKMVTQKEAFKPIELSKITEYKRIIIARFGSSDVLKMVTEKNLLDLNFRWSLPL